VEWSVPLSPVSKREKKKKKKKGEEGRKDFGCKNVSNTLVAGLVRYSRSCVQKEKKKKKKKRGKRRTIAFVEQVRSTTLV